MRLPETSSGSVCLENFEGSNNRTMPYSHSFHEQCIFNWLRISSRKMVGLDKLVPKPVPCNLVFDMWIGCNMRWMSIGAG